MRSLCSLVGLAIACAGIGLFSAIGFYVWAIKREVNEQTAVLTTRANAAGDEADKAIKFVDNVINQAKDDLEGARAVATNQPKRPVSMMERVLAQKASQNLAGSVDRAHLAVQTASDAVVVAEAALDVFNSNPEFKRLLGIKPGQVDTTKNALGGVAGELRQAKTILGVPISTDGGAPTDEQLNAVDSALRQARGFTDELSRVVTTVRGRINETKTTVDRWSWQLSIAITAICALGAVGQFFMARYFWRTYRGLAA